MRAERGFTLVEALVAFAILATVLVALYGAVGTSLNGLARSKRFDEAVLIAQSRLAELAAARALPHVSEGEVEGTTYRWRIECVADANPEPPELAASPVRLQRLNLIVTWDENGRWREIAVERQVQIWREANR